MSCKSRIFFRLFTCSRFLWDVKRNARASARLLPVPCHCCTRAAFGALRSSAGVFLQAGAIMDSDAGSVVSATSNGQRARGRIAKPARGSGGNEDELNKDGGKARATERVLNITPYVEFLYHAPPYFPGYGDPARLYLFESDLRKVFPWTGMLRTPHFAVSNTACNKAGNEFADYVRNSRNMVKLASRFHSPVVMSYEAAEEAVGYWDLLDDRGVPSTIRDALSDAKDRLIQVFDDNAHYAAVENSESAVEYDITDHFSKVCSFLQLSSKVEKCPLLYNISPHVDDFFFPQHNPDIYSSTKMYGHQGGLRGAMQGVCFWSPSFAEDTRSTSTDLLTLASLLAQGINGHFGKQVNENQWFVMPTDYVDPMGFHNHKRVSGVRYATRGDSSILTKKGHYDQWTNDTDVVLRTKVENYREVEKGLPSNENEMDLLCDDSRRLVQDPCHGKRHNEEDEILKPCVLANAFVMTLGCHFYTVYDTHNTRNVIRVDVIRINPITPFTDPITAINHAIKGIQELSDSLMKVLEPMCMYIHSRQCPSLESLFAYTTSDIDIMSLTDEHRLPMALAKFSAEKNCGPVNYGGMIFNWKNMQSRTLYENYCNAILKTRREQSQEIWRSSELDLGIARNWMKPKRQVDSTGENSPLDLIGDTSFHFRSAPKSFVYAQGLCHIAERVKQCVIERSLCEDDQETIEMSNNLLAEFEALCSTFYADESSDPLHGNFYFPAAGPLINTGVVMLLGQKSFGHYQPPNNQVLLQNRIPILEQPQIIVPAIYFYIKEKTTEIESTRTSPYACFWTNDKIIPDVIAIRQQFEKEQALFPAALWGFFSKIATPLTKIGKISNKVM